MAGSFRSALPLLGFGAPGAAPPPPAGGFYSLLGFWLGGAGVGTAAPHVPVEPSPNGGRHHLEFDTVRLGLLDELHDDGDIVELLAMIGPQL